MGVLLFFLRSLASTLVIAISIPFSIIATFVLMYASGFTLNIMSLGGLAMGVGMMVDNSIVVLENGFRLRQEGQPAAEAAVHGAGEVTAAVIASTLTTLVVFLPLIFIRGVSGVMYKQLALVVSFSLICSLVSSLTLVPMMSARLLARPHGGRAAAGPFPGPRPSAGWSSFYTGLLSRVLNRPLLTVGLIVLAMGASLLLVPLIGSELMPVADEGQVRINGEMEAGTRLELTDQAFQDLERRTREAVPEIQTMVTSVGGGFRSAGTSTGPDQPDPGAAPPARPLRRPGRRRAAPPPGRHPGPDPAHAHQPGLLPDARRQLQHRAHPDRGPRLRPEPRAGRWPAGSGKWSRRRRGSRTCS